MFFLGLDYGEKYIGVAYANDDITYPLEIIANDKSTFVKLKQMVDLYEPDLVVVGVANEKENSPISKKAKKFGNALGQNIDTKVVFFEEEYSTQDAKEISGQLGFKTDKRIDDVAASVLLQNYLDDKNN